MITKLDAIPPGDNITGLIYGGSGTSKSWICGTAGDRALIVDCGTSRQTLQGAKFKSIVKANPYVLNMQQELKSYDYKPTSIPYDSVCDAIEKALKEDGDKFDWLIVDETNALRRYAMSKALEINNATNKSKSADKIEKYNVPIIGVQDYGMEMAIISQFIAVTIALANEYNKHFIMTAMERLTFQKGSNIGDAPNLINVRPGFTGQTFPDEVQGMFGFTWHTEIKGSGNNMKYCVQTESSGVVQAKTRYNGIFEMFEVEPNLLNVLARIQAAKLNPKVK